jgi:hypothetical protein
MTAKLEDAAFYEMVDEADDGINDGSLPSVLEYYRMYMSSRVRDYLAEKFGDEYVTTPLYVQYIVDATEGVLIMYVGTRKRDAFSLANGNEIAVFDNEPAAVELKALGLGVN